MSYLNSPRKVCPRGMQICVWTHLGLIKWKTTSNKNEKWNTTSEKIKNGRQPQKEKKNGRQPQKNGRQPQKNKMEDNLKKKRKTT